MSLVSDFLRLTSAQRHTFLAAFLGWTMDSLDLFPLDGESSKTGSPVLQWSRGRFVAKLGTTPCSPSSFRAFNA
jgi:hypothetical protein